MNRFRRTLLRTAALVALAPGLALAQSDVVKIGLILPMTGPFASTGRQIEAAAQALHGEERRTVAGKKIELILKDDAGTPDTAKRIAQELVVNDKVAFLAGFGLTPLALATAPIATQAKVPMVVMAAATSMITEASPFIVRTGFTLPQSAAPMADWAAKNGIKKVVTLVTDYAPGHRRGDGVQEAVHCKPAARSDELRVPLRNPDFAPFLQRVRDAKPDAVFVFVPSGVGLDLHEAVRGARPRQVAASS